MSNKFQKLVKHLPGRELNELVLGHIDLCSTTIDISYYILPGLNHQATLTQLQTSFCSALSSVAEIYPNLKIIQASNSAFVIGEADEVLQGIIKIFLLASSIFYAEEEIVAPIPLRSAIADGLVEFTGNTGITRPRNLNEFPYWGDAFSKIEYMEKIGQQGINIFVSDAIKERLSKTYSSSILLDKYIEEMDLKDIDNENFYIFNWLIHVPSQIGDILSHEDINDDDCGLKWLVYFIKAAEKWVSANEEDCYQKFGKMLLELRDKFR